MSSQIINLKTGPVGRAFIKDFEKKKNRAYRSGQDSKWTIGWGHTRTAREGMVITDEQAETLFEQDLEEAERAIKSVVSPYFRLSQLCFDALVSWEFNCGAIRSKGNTIRRFLKEGRLDEIDEQILRWKFFTDPMTGEKKVSTGLARRRAAEARMWNDGLADIAEADYVTPVVVENPPSVDEENTTKLAVGAGTTGTGAAALLAAEEETGVVSKAIEAISPLAFTSKHVALLLVMLTLISVFLMWRKSRRN